MEILVGKWKHVILFHLFANGTMRFGQLQRAIPDITKKMLTRQLRELEYHDFAKSITTSRDCILSFLP